MNNRGFTLIELLITIAIIGIVTTFAVSSYVGVIKKAARSEAYTNLQNLRLLEEQFFAENGRYTINLGVDGNNAATRDANNTAIRTTANNALPGFRPGNDSNFVYWIVSAVQLPAAPGVPFVPGTVVAVVAPNQCFVALARGITNTRVVGDVFAIDCNNNRNF